MDKIIVYADGGCRNNQSRENIGGYGIRMEYGSVVKELKGNAKNTTNNIMELTSCIEALKIINRKSIPTVVVMDSQYVILGMNKWIYNWINNGWKNSQRKTVENKELWKELLELKNQFHDIQFVKCKGHSDNIGNNRADKLANEAMDEIES